jgi:Domain of unknown function (DUF202)
VAHSSEVFDSSVAAIERTYLSHLRLGLVLALLSASILLNARLPAPNDEEDPTSSRSQLQGLKFGSLYFAAAIAGFFGGLLNYDKLWSGMKSGKAFVQSPRSVLCLGLSPLGS